MRYYLLNLYIGRVLVAVLADMLCFAAAATVTWFVLSPPFPVSGYVATTVAGAFASFVALYYSSAYSLDVLGSARDTMSSLIAAMGLAFILALVVYFAVSLPPHTAETLAHVAGLYFPFLILERVLFRFVSALPRLSQRVLVIGTSDLGLAIAHAVRRRSNLGTEMTGFLSDEVDEDEVMVEGFPVLGRAHEVEKIIEREQIGRVVVASKSRREYFPSEELLAAKLSGCRIESGVGFYERITGRVYLRELRQSYLVFGSGFRSGRIAAAIKRSFDVIVAGIGLAAYAPFLALCAILIPIDSRGPVFYRQWRVGKDGKLFQVMKLRSMKHRAEAETGPRWSDPDDARITRVGRLLRKARLDEFPQLWNVLKGDMSLVGPRPERPEFVDSLTQRYPYFRLRATVRPGITGWAQTRFGYVNDVSGFEEKLALDLYYLKYRSVSMDLLILWKTIKTVVLLHGV